MLEVQGAKPKRRGLKRQGDRKGRPYHTTKRLAKPVYSRGGACPRPGKAAYNSLRPHLWGEAFCRGSGCPRKNLISLLAAAGGE
jgi:hypothetical protein